MGANAMSYADIPDGFQLVDPQQGAAPDISALASAIQTQEGYFPGSRSYRNNNPGNIKFGPFAQNNGATGADDEGHAIFPTYDAGHSALTALLSSPKYAGKSVSQIGTTYAEDSNWAAGVSKILARGQTAQPMRLGPPDDSTSDIPHGFQIVEQDARQSSAPLPPSPTSGLTVDPKGGAPLPQPVAGQPVHATDLLRPFVGQGMGAGFGDEAEAATRAAYDKAQGDQRPFGQIYDAQLDRVRGKIKQFAQDEPFLSTGSEIAGAIAPAIATRGETAPGSVLNAMGKGALQGAAYGGAYGFGSGEGMPERLIGSGLGAITGGGVGGLAPLAAEGLVRGGRYIKNALVDAFSPTGGAANRLGSAVAADEASRAALPQNVTSVPKQGLTPQEFADAQSRGQPVTNIERGGENVRALASDAAITSPTARDTLNSTIDQRFEGQGDRITDFVRNLVGGTDATTTRDDLLSQASKANRPAYARAFADPNGKSLWDEGFQQLMTSPDVQAAAKAATRTGANKAAAQGFNPIKNPFVEGADGRLQLRTNPDGSAAASQSSVLGCGKAEP